VLENEYAWITTLTKLKRDHCFIHYWTIVNFLMKTLWIPKTCFIFSLLQSSIFPFQFHFSTWCWVMNERDLFGVTIFRFLWPWKNHGIDLVFLFCKEESRFIVCKGLKVRESKLKVRWNGNSLLKKLFFSFSVLYLLFFLKFVHRAFFLF
jgi:hypothetical protein